MTDIDCDLGNCDCDCDFDCDFGSCCCGDSDPGGCCCGDPDPGGCCCGDPGGCCCGDSDPGGSSCCFSNSDDSDKLLCCVICIGSRDNKNKNRNNSNYIDCCELLWRCCCREIKRYRTTPENWTKKPNKEAKSAAAPVMNKEEEEKKKRLEDDVISEKQYYATCYSCNRPISPYHHKHHQYLHGGSSSASLSRQKYYCSRCASDIPPTILDPPSFQRFQILERENRNGRRYGLYD